MKFVYDNFIKNVLTISLLRAILENDSHDMFG